MGADLLKSKTFWTSVAGILGTLLLWWTGQLTANESLAAIWAALQTLWLRDAVKSTGERVVKANLLVAQAVTAHPVMVVTPEGPPEA